MPARPFGEYHYLLAVRVERTGQDVCVELHLDLAGLGPG